MVVSGTPGTTIECLIRYDSASSAVEVGERIIKVSVVGVAGGGTGEDGVGVGVDSLVCWRVCGGPELTPRRPAITVVGCQCETGGCYWF